MTHPNINRTPLSRQVADGVIRMIHEKGLGEGDQLPATADLADEFGVSRTVVREALAELSGRGLLVRQQGREGVFSLPGSVHIEQLLTTRLQYQSIDRVDLHEFRSVVEVGACRMAAVNATAADVLSMRALLAEIESATDDDSLHDADLALHQAISDATHNPMFSLVLDALFPLLHQSRRDAWSIYVKSGGQLSTAISQHRDIVERIAAGDPDGAAQAMELDLEDAHKALMGNVSTNARRGRTGARAASRPRARR